ncbi:MAG: GntR family transcriptional regulator [Armatimonadetes bacterium]|nr:GntR family transcriptional regulator [Armatimonadota bacterium]
MSSLICAEEIAYSELKQRVLDGRLAPGERLVHRALAKDLGMSPNPVVLALRMLERDGLVTNTPGLGARVRTWTREEIVDSYHIRAFHEALAARLCAERATMSDLEAINKAHEAILQSVDELDAKANIKAELDFHIAIAKGAHCPDLERVFENLSIVHRSMTAFGISLNVPRLLSPQIREIHTTIIEAIKNRDPDAAEKAARDHVEGSLARNLAWIEKISAAMVDSAASRMGSRANPSVTVRFP